MDAPHDIQKPPLGVAHEVVGKTIIISPIGDLDMATCPRLGLELNDVLRKMPSRILIDLSGVEFLDSTGLSILLNTRRRALRQRTDLRIVCDVPQTLRLLDLTRLRPDFDVYPSREHALAQ